MPVTAPEFFLPYAADRAAYPRSRRAARLTPPPLGKLSEFRYFHGMSLLAKGNLRRSAARRLGVRRSLHAIRGPSMSRTLPLAREAFLAEINRETTGTERPRFAVVLDALIEWSVARPELLAFRADDGPSIGVSFERVGSKVVFWSARVMRGKVPKLEIDPPTGRSLRCEDRDKVMQTMNAISRE